MKTIFRALMIGLVMTAFTAVSAFAQTNPCDDSYETKQAIYGLFRTNKIDTKESPRTLDKAKAAVKSGEEFVSKYGACEADKTVVDYINKNLPDIKEYVRRQELYARFNDSISDIKNVNADEAYASGKEIMKFNPDLALDIEIVLAQIAYDNSIKTPPVDKYNNEGVGFAKQVIKDLEAGKTSKNFGAKVYSMAILDAQKKPDAAKSKQNVLGWMNYMIGSIMYYNQQNKKDAVPYFYQATKYDSPTKNKPDVYQAVGAWYLEELLKMDGQRLEIVKTNGDKDNEQSLAMFAMEKGYADRGIDAYARAYKIANADATAKPEYKKGLRDKLEGLYKFRFDKTEGIDAYIATIASKPMPDPATAVTPVVEETKPAATTTGTTTTTNPGTTTKPPTTDATTKPATTTKPTTDTTTKPGTTTKPTSTTTTTKPSISSKTKTPVKPKTATTKKKGTR